MAYILQRLVALYIIVKGWDYSEHSGWRAVIGTIIFTIGAVLFEWSIRRKQHRELMPYTWECQRCPTIIETSVQAATDALRQEHNRTVHLQEF